MSADRFRPMQQPAYGGGYPGQAYHQQHPNPYGYSHHSSPQPYPGSHAPPNNYGVRFARVLVPNDAW